MTRWGCSPWQSKVISWVDGETPLYTGKHVLRPLENCACVASVTYGPARARIYVCGDLCVSLSVSLSRSGARIWEPVPL